MKHKTTLLELQKMFTHLMVSLGKALGRKKESGIALSTFGPSWQSGGYSAQTLDLSGRGHIAPLL